MTSTWAAGEGKLSCTVTGPGPVEGLGKITRPRVETGVEVGLGVAVPVAVEVAVGVDVAATIMTLLVLDWVEPPK